MSGKNKYLRFLLVVFMSLCCGLINAASFTPFLQAEASSAKPNIIYIFSDEQLFA